jgi:hypothetical protein
VLGTELEAVPIERNYPPVGKHGILEPMVWVMANASSRFKKERERNLLSEEQRGDL